MPMKTIGVLKIYYFMSEVDGVLTIKFIGANFPLDETTPVPSITPTTHSIKEIPLSKPQEGMIDPSFFNTILKRRSYRDLVKSLYQLKTLVYFCGCFTYKEPP